MYNLPKEHIIPNIEDWPISKFADQRDEFITQLVDYSFNKIVQANPEDLQEIISKTLYLEKNRSKNNKWAVDPADEEQYWKSLNIEFQEILSTENSKEKLETLIKRIINRYSEEIVGGFTPKAFKFARKMTTIFFKALMNKMFQRGKRPFWGSRGDLLERFKIYGELEEIRSLFQKGTVVIVPNHLSNIDSLLIGFIIDQIVKVPAFLYGAGLNLYDVELVAYYFNRLGTYRVDRRKKNPIYLTVLKSMASLSLVEGVNNIFFPGGTRSRSGSIENKLKLGLLNSVVEAQQLLIQKGSNEKLFIVPMVMSYPFVLEAKPLIEQYLRKKGLEKYRSSKERVGKFRYIRHFLWTMAKKKTEVHVSFGKPRDVLGNYVDMEGQSLDSSGQVIDIKQYFMSLKGLNKDEQRESIYTRVLADRITGDYIEINPILSGEIVAYLFFKFLEKAHPELNIFRLINIPPKNFKVDKIEMIREITVLMSELRREQLTGNMSLSEILNDSGTIAEDILYDGINQIGVYHLTKVLKWNTNRTISSEDFRLLYYYHNKLDGYRLSYKLNGLKEPKKLTSTVI